jgi:hypothetical protein
VPPSSSRPAPERRAIICSIQISAETSKGRSTSTSSGHRCAIRLTTVRPIGWLRRARITTKGSMGLESCLRLRCNLCLLPVNHQLLSIGGQAVEGCSRGMRLWGTAVLGRAVVCTAHLATRHRRAPRRPRAKVGLNGRRGGFQRRCGAGCWCLYSTIHGCHIL